MVEFVVAAFEHLCGTQRPRRSLAPSCCRLSESSKLRRPPDESRCHGSNEAMEISGVWMFGGGWLRSVKGERNLEHTSKIAKMYENVLKCHMLRHTWSNFNPSRSAEDVPSTL